MRIARDSVRDNPLIVAYHFERRYEAFFKEVLKPKLHLTDYWNRYEWQDRESSLLLELPRVDYGNDQSRQWILECDVMAIQEPWQNFIYRRHIVTYCPRSSQHVPPSPQSTSKERNAALPHQIGARDSKEVAVRQRYIPSKCSCNECSSRLLIRRLCMSLQGYATRQ
jgi:Helitron helicase-like domain at N-terminus